jgi:ubiquinone biosynthesis protein UbiJ
MSEFLQFESNTVPSRHEVQGFCREVDDVQLRMDSLQAGVDLLNQRKKV